MPDIWSRVRIGAAVAVVAGGAAIGSPGLSRAGAAVGSSWTVVATGNTSLPDNHLNAISCVAASDCWAVGSSDAGPGFTSEPSLAEHWNGVAWSIVATPNTRGEESTSGGFGEIVNDDAAAVR